MTVTSGPAARAGVTHHAAGSAGPRMAPAGVPLQVFTGGMGVSSAGAGGASGGLAAALVLFLIVPAAVAGRRMLAGRARAPRPVFVLLAERPG
jgi:hypothetical protein